MSVHYIKCHVFFSPGTGNIKELLKFWNLSKKRKKKKKQWNNKTKKIFNRVPPECFYTAPVIEWISSLLHLLNYTHLQNLTRSLAKKKKKNVVGTIICQDSVVGKLEGLLTVSFSAVSQMEPGKNETLSLNMNCVYLSFNHRHHFPSSVVS